MRKLFILGLAVLGIQCSDNNNTMKYINDAHSFAKPNQAVMRHLSLDLLVDFAEQKIKGTAQIDINYGDSKDSIILDTKGLQIISVTDSKQQALEFNLKPEVQYLGSALVIYTKGANSIRIQYETGKDAAALQWLSPQQTNSKKEPFLFTQSQAILARTWIPLQDSPSIRFSYDAKVTCPSHLLALMSAENPTQKNDKGVYTFIQNNPIPAYLMALSVGDLEYHSYDNKTGVYAEPEIMDICVNEFKDLPSMLNAAESIYGAYRWGKYDLLVLPPSFPFGGMENPELTFATPTILAGDRSLVSLVAHELAHSWSGNLVTNATWNDFWLNEGFTVYFERRIMEAIEGKEYADMLSVLGFQDLQASLSDYGAENPDTHLKLKLEGRDPDEGVSDIAYEKGFALLRTIENAVGRPAFDPFLNQYFNQHAFQSMNTEDFIQILKTDLFKANPSLYDSLKIDDWIYGPGLPPTCIAFTSSKMEAVNAALEQWKNGKSLKEIPSSDWSTHEWLYFTNNLPKTLTQDQFKDLDAYGPYAKTQNAEILDAWFVLAINNQFESYYPKIEDFLVKVGRRKFLMPLYKAMMSSDKGKAWAKQVYAKARPNYHFVAVQSLDALIN
jgi:leukotriene-A4 hydrolase